MKQLLSSLVLLLFAAGCVPLVLGPSVLIMPAQGKPFQMFQQEMEECKAYALREAGGEGAVQMEQQNAASHALIGALIGVASGGLIGAGVGNAGAGAGIGAGTGLAAGSISGAHAARSSGGKLQQLYDNAYLQCMYAKGNQVSNQQ